MSGEPNTTDNLTRFSDRVAAYVAARPSYPPAAIDAILDGLGDPASIRAADIGAGTGISALLLADRGVNVVAVEPNDAMRTAIPAHPNVTPLRGTAERTGLDDHGTNLILCAQAYHWFEPTLACAEFARILAPEGRMVLMWNDHDDDSPVAGTYIRLVMDAGEIDDLPHRRIARQPEIVAPLQRIDAITVPNAQRLTIDGLLERARSASYVPKEGPRWDALERALGKLHADYADDDDLVTFQYVTRIHIAER
ncbi:MAG: methyltransferase domain-containing protein [Planctomycetota bacterium]